MVERNQENSDESKRSDSWTDDDPAGGSGRPESAEGIKTQKSASAAGPVMPTSPTSSPDQPMVIETSRIREPNEPFHSGLVMVPVEVNPQPRDRGATGKDQGQEKQNKVDQEKIAKNPSGQDANAKNDRSSSQQDRADDEHGRGDHSGQ